VEYKNISALDVQARVGLGYYTSPFAFSTKEEFPLSPRDWTINTLTRNHLGLMETNYAEADCSLSYMNGTKILNASLYKVSPTGTATLLGTGTYTITETSKTLISFVMSMLGFMMILEQTLFIGTMVITHSH